MIGQIQAFIFICTWTKLQFLLSQSNIVIVLKTVKLQEASQYSYTLAETKVIEYSLNMQSSITEH